MYLLGRRDYGTRELERKLFLKGYEKDAIDELLKYFSEIGYLNDRNLIDRLVSYQISGNKSRRQIEAYLLKKGFDCEDIRLVLCRHDFLELEDNMLARQINRLMKAGKPISREKIISRLLSKGFSYQKIKKQLDKYIE